MTAVQWLERHAPGFADLGHRERFAPMEFALIWSFFEATSLNARGSVAMIEARIRELDRQGRLRPIEFVPALHYFRQRYFAQGQFTHKFHSLNLRPADLPLVEAVLSGQSNDPVDSAVAVFVIIYRFRNHFFHGEKWAYHLMGQLQNFETANESLMRLMEM